MTNQNKLLEDGHKGIGKDLGVGVNVKWKSKGTEVRRIEIIDQVERGLTR